YLSHHTAPTALYTLSLHDALPICAGANDRLVITATDQADTFVLDTITPLAGLTGQLTASGSSQMQILHRGVEAVEIDSRAGDDRSEEHTSELQSRFDLVCRLLLEK